MFLASAHKSRKKIPLVTTNQVKRMLNSSKKFVMIMVKIGALGEVNLMLLKMCNTDFRLPMTYKREE